MALDDAFQYTFAYEVLEETSREDGSPVYETTTKEMQVWFDEPAGSRFTSATRTGRAVPAAQRRAIMWTKADSGIEHKMQGSITGPDGVGYGTWTVEIVRRVPGFDSVSHIECEIQGVIETG